MKKKIIYVLSACVFVFFILSSMFLFRKDEELKSEELEATVIKTDIASITLRDSNDCIYTFNKSDLEDAIIGDNLIIEYTGLLDKNKNLQKVNVEKYEIVNLETDEDGIPISWQDDGIFSDYYVLAYNKLQKLSLEEKIGQLLLVRYFDEGVDTALEKYKFSGFVFYEKDFKDKTKAEVINMIDNLQEKSKIPLLTAVDEEGGDVVRVSSNPNLALSRFKSPKELYDSGGFAVIENDTINKSKLLESLGLNLNLAPVVDVATDSDAYIYNRTIKEDVNITSEYAKKVIEASKDFKVSYTLKHFPGYGNNTNTHISSSTDTRSYEEIITNDLKPFEAGIEVGAEAILFGHNIVTSIDPDYPASLSISAHNLLRNKLKFTGVAITDDISMEALKSVSKATITAIEAGNNLVITSDYEASFKAISDAIYKGEFSEELIDRLVFKVLAWKYYKGLMIDVK